jgi:hypothetical protein
LAKNKKIAKHAVEPTLLKQPKSTEPEISGQPLAWRFSGCDSGGPFSWAGLAHGEPFREVIDRLHEFERMNWEEIKRTGSHPIEIWKCEKLARDRLAEIQQDDIDQLMSFRIGAKKRVWCIQDLNIMRVLWWDPEHEVCLSLKKHT